MRFFKRAPRPGGSRRIAAVAGAVAVAAVVLAGDGPSLAWPAVFDAVAVLGPGPGPVASGRRERAVAGLHQTEHAGRPAARLDVRIRGAG